MVKGTFFSKKCIKKSPNVIMIRIKIAIISCKFSGGLFLFSYATFMVAIFYSAEAKPRANDHFTLPRLRLAGKMHCPLSAASAGKAFIGPNKLPSS